MSAARRTSISSRGSSSQFSIDPTVMISRVSWTGVSDSSESSRSSRSSSSSSSSVSSSGTMHLPLSAAPLYAPSRDEDPLRYSPGRGGGVIVSLAYGDSRLEVALPSTADVTVVEPTYRRPVADPPAVLRTALRSPIAGRPLRELVTPGQSLAISICDGTRPQPREAMLTAILDELEGIVRLDDVTVLVATGTHRGNTPDEL